MLSFCDNELKFHLFVISTDESGSEAEAQNCNEDPDDNNEL